MICIGMVATCLIVKFCSTSSDHAVVQRRILGRKLFMSFDGGFNTTSEYALYFTGSTVKNIRICLDGANHDAVTPAANFNLRVRRLQLVI